MCFLITKACLSKALQGHSLDLYRHCFILSQCIELAIRTLTEDYLRHIQNQYGLSETHILNGLEELCLGH